MKPSDYYIVGDGDERHYVVESIAPNLYRIGLPDGRVLEVNAYQGPSGQLHLLADNESIQAHINDDLAPILGVQSGFQSSQLRVLTAREKRRSIAGVGDGNAGGPELVSPMAGKVVAIMASVGDVVEKGQTIVVVEAMKMENDLKAHKDGIIQDIMAQAGATVEIGDVLLTIGEAS